MQQRIIIVYLFRISVTLRIIGNNRRVGLRVLSSVVQGHQFVYLNPWLFLLHRHGLCLEVLVPVAAGLICTVLLLCLFL